MHLKIIGFRITALKLLDCFLKNFGSAEEFSLLICYMHFFLLKQIQHYILFVLGRQIWGIPGQVQVNASNHNVFDQIS